jgi:hypothetical protein
MQVQSISSMPLPVVVVDDHHHCLPDIHLVCVGISQW